MHGGHLIRFIEEAGFVAATRQVAFGGSGGKLGALARIEHLDFLAPVEVLAQQMVSEMVSFFTACESCTNRVLLQQQCCFGSEGWCRPFR